MAHRILIVDDEANYRKVLAMMLADFDVELAEAEDGVAALARLEKEPGVDLVLTDMNMPNMGGMELLAKLREQTSPPPVVVITAHSSVDSAVAAMQAGAID